MADGLTPDPPAIELRPVGAGDRELLVAIYRSTREDELALTDWDEEQRAAFIEMQFSAQDRSYRDSYPDGRFQLIVVGGHPVGRVYWAVLADELRIIDIAILAAHRAAGIGTSVLGALLAEADAAGLAVRLHVEPWNPARRLYERLGFRSLDVRGPYEFMERPAVDQLNTAS